MQNFHCDNCGSLLFFENVQCLNCGYFLGFLPDILTLSSLEATGDGICRPMARGAHGRAYRKCANQQQYRVCNWLVPVEDHSPFCASCRLNTVIPNLAASNNLERWRKLEQAKRRVLYTLFRLGLPVEGNRAGDRPPLHFKFLSDEPGKPVLTGHCHGEITINIAEADEDERERRRVGLHEPYRTLVGHFRHEVAHYYWDYLIANTSRLDGFREVFGDETQDYGASLQAYYHKGPPVDWHKRYVSAYACSHPWEDWAETWAHYLHMVDTLEIAASFGVTVGSAQTGRNSLTSNPAKAVNRAGEFDEILEHWLPLTTAVNSFNRAMGLPDLYPFILSNKATEKMRFIHDIIRGPIPTMLPVAPPPVRRQVEEMATANAA